MIAFVEALLELHKIKDEIIEALLLQVETLEQRVKKLEEQVAKNSQNSSKPPSSDGYTKPSPKSLRQSGQTNPGAQKGHRGSSLTKHPNPDVAIVHAAINCVECGQSLMDEKVCDYEHRQVFDIPPLKLTVTEHRAEIKRCPCCSKKTTAPFPELVTQALQYGTNLKSWVVYLNHYQLLPYRRIRELVKDMFGHSLSEGSIFSMTEQCFEQLEVAEEGIKQQLQAAHYLHCDESGIRVAGKLHWCHVVSTEHLTAYNIHPKRGGEAIKQMDILPNYRGTLIHDHFKPYWGYETQHQHGLCNAHHLRELTFVYEQNQQRWAKHMLDLLLAIKKQVAWHREQDLVLRPSRIEAFEKCYFDIIQQGVWHPDNQVSPAPAKQGVAKQSKAKNLLDRLRHYYRDVLAFMYRPALPFDNNQAERDIRMVKVKQKISGCFRTLENAQRFCRVRAYISTAKKNSQSAFTAIQNAFLGNPLIPSTHSPPL